MPNSDQLSVVSSFTLADELIGNFGGLTQRIALGNLLAQSSVAWNNASYYSAGKVVVGSDGNHYRCVASTMGDDPTNDDGTYWKLSLVAYSVTLNVPSRFATFDAVWAFVAGAYFSPGPTATLKFADGYHNLGTTRKVLNHPFGLQIRIIGNESDREACILDCRNMLSPGMGTLQPDWGALSVHTGHELGFINGFTLYGPGTEAYQLCGLLAINFAKINAGGAIWSRDFALPIAAHTASAMFFGAGLRASRGGDACIFAYAGSTIECPECLAEEARIHYARCGILAEHCSVIRAPNSVFKNNLGSQVGCNYGSSLMINGSTLLAEGGLAGTVGSVQMISADGCDLDGCTYTGVSAPQARVLNLATDEVAEADGGNQVRLGFILPTYAFNARAVIGSVFDKNNHLVIAQHNHVEAWFGHQAQSVDANGVLQISNSRPAIELRGNVLKADKGGGGDLLARFDANAATLGKGLIASVQALSGAGAVSLTTICTDITSTGANSLTLANGTSGQLKILTMVVDGGDATLTPTTKTGFTTLTFNDVGDTAILQYHTTLGWMLVGTPTATAA